MTSLRVAALMLEMRKEAEMHERALLEELRSSEARFRAICEAAPLGIYVSEIPVGVVYVNPAMQEILGRSEAELLGQGWKQYLHPDDAARALGERSTHYEKATPMRVAARYLRSDGSVIWTQLRAAPIREGDELRGYVGMLEDISEHRALQAQLVMAGRLASVGTLAAGVAHEVNTPLAVTLGNLEWVQARLSSAIAGAERAADELGIAAASADLIRRVSELSRPLHDAHEAAQRVSLIMKDLTLFSRPEADEESVADLKRVLASTARMASHELKHRARLVHDYGELPWVHGSEARLGQVFLNLLINAAHAIPEGHADDHEVRIHARVSEPGMVMVEVRDTGVGIEPSVLERIFDPFFTTKAPSLGTGLGLAICHRIVSGLGGRIEVESKPTRGSAFRVLLRSRDPIAHAGPTPEEPVGVPQRRNRVLVIDDDEQLLRSMGTMLGEANQVETTTSARAALARLQAGERYDAVLCDLIMPDMTGMEFHAQLSKMLPEVVERVIFMTGGAVTTAAREFLARVPNARVDKPFSLRELNAVLEDRTGAERASS